MSKRRFIKGNLDKNDFDRVVLTDTAPAELPIIISNDGFYENLKGLRNRHPDIKKLFDALLERNQREYTIPYRYRVTKDSISTRRLSLIHPASQKSVCKFYEEYANLICYYNSKSSFSIRAPARLGSLYFFSNSDAERNKYKRSGIDTTDFDQRVRNPASFFSYRGHDRVYRFFESPKFTNLEKKFPTLWMADVSKCFDSIYTHSVTWALKNMDFAKRSIGRRSFGAEFDRIMQKMNYNETNGICIGPEVSRIFAETIFQEVDLQIELAAVRSGLRQSRDFSCVRYVDDIFLFARDEATAKSIYAIVEEELGKFNLHLNDHKLVKLDRPFQTNKSRSIQGVQQKLRAFQEKTAETIPSDVGKRRIPRHIYRPISLQIEFQEDIKSVCKTVGVGYDFVANYVIASLANQLESLLEAYQELPSEVAPAIEEYIRSIHLILELMFHYYAMHPTVSSSFRVSKAIVISLEFLARNEPARTAHIVEELVRWLADLADTFRDGSQKLVTNRIPVEVINIALAISQHDDGLNLPIEFVSRKVFPEKKLEYFSTVSLLFLIKNKPEYQKMRREIEKKLLILLNDKFNPKQKAHDAHLLLDVAACPYLTLDLRKKFVAKLWVDQLGLGAIGQARLTNLVKDIEKHPWFVKWGGIDLLNMIKRKELSHVY